MRSIKDIVNSWNEFFFKPQPVESIAIFRILWCTMLLVAALFDFQNIHDFYGPHAILSLATVKSQFQTFHLNIFHLFNASYEFVYILFGVYILALISSIIGFYSRTSLVIALIAMVSFHQRNIWLLSSSELLMRLTMILLVCSPSGHAYSVDSLLGRKFPLFKKERIWSPWALRLIQIQLAVVYLWTFWHKLKGDTWFDGTALYYATRLDAMKNFPVPFILDWLPAIKLMTWMTLFLELALGTLIWFKEFRRPLIILGIGFHLSIEYMMSIPFFEIVMILLLTTYIEPTTVKAFFIAKREQWAKLVELSNMEAKLKEKFIWVLRQQA